MANKLVSSYFRLNNVKQFIESIDEPANTMYYVFGGKPSQYSLGDSAIDAQNSTIRNLHTTVYDEMVFAKQITASDVKTMANRVTWTAGTVYSMYDDLDLDLENKNFFVSVLEGGTYYVYKCLFNNNGGAVSSTPSFGATGADDIIYETADGYIWKYLYKITSTDFTKFSTSSYIPVTPDSNVSSNAISGAIDIIKINSGGLYYHNYLSGSFATADLKWQGVAVQYRITAATASSIASFYSGCIIKIISGTGNGQYRQIESYTIAADKFITIATPFSINLDATSQYQISPQIKIYGDGKQYTNAVARALINASSSNSIYKIDILNRGTNYFLASCNVYAHSSVRTANSINDASLRPIIGPKGGHGYDVESELYSSHLGISVKFSNNENNTISIENDFRTIGILKDPKFNTVKLTHGTALGAGFTDTEQLVQLNIKRLGGSVAVSSTSKNLFSLGTLTIVSVDPLIGGNGIFSNTDVMTISNVAVIASCNIQTNSFGNIYTTAVVSPGFGFSDSVSPLMSIANSAGKNIRHVNGDIITTVAFANHAPGVSTSANGSGYHNSDIIIISSPTSTIDARANITTNATGGILSVVMSNSGKGFSNNGVGLIDIAAVGVNFANGLGYSSIACNALTITGGGGTGAVATYANNSTGNIVSITLVSPGYGYTSAPTVTGPGSPTVAATFNVILSAAPYTLRVANSLGTGYSNGAKVISAVVSSTGAALFSNTLDIIVFPSPSNPTNGNATAAMITGPSTGALTSGQLITVNPAAGGNLNSGFNLDPSGSLFSYVANTTGGNKRYLNYNIVAGLPISVANCSPVYRVNNVTFSGGTGYNSTQIASVSIVDGGTGYDSTANNILIFGSGVANGTFANNSLGSIISASITARGTGYTSSPTVTVNAAALGAGANLVAVLANSLVFTSNPGGYGAVGYFGNDASGVITSVAIANSGFNYTTAPLVTVPGTVGSGVALAAIVIGGANNFSSSHIIYVTNGSINAVANIVANTTGFITGATMTDSGRGFTYSTAFPYATDTVGSARDVITSNTRYFNNTSIRDLVLNNAGFTNFYDNNDILTVSGGTINALSKILTNATSGIISPLSLYSSGLAFANHSVLTFRIANSTGGNLRYLNSYVVNGHSVSDGGLGYSNTDYVVISSPNSLSAKANVITTSLGTIANLTFTDRGKDITPWSISAINITASGSGYANTDKWIASGGGGSFANGFILTNVSGAITKIHIANSGINYDCAPAILIYSSGGTVLSTGISASLTPSITKPSILRIYDANNNLSSGKFADLGFTLALTANVSANLIYSPFFGNSTYIANVQYSGGLTPTLGESANMFFSSTKSANLSINLTGQTSSFDSSLGAGDYVFLQTSTNQSQLIQVASVTNSSHLVLTDFPTFDSNAVAISAANVKASGVISDKAAGYVNVSNVTGFFTQSNFIYGMSSQTSANISTISFNGVSKTGVTVNQLQYYGLNTPITGITFQEDEIVTYVHDQNDLNSEVSTAFFHSTNGAGIFVTSQNGKFYPGTTLTGSTSGATANLSSGSTYKYEGDFVRGSGDIIYLENIEPISISTTQSETIKIIVEF